MLFSSTFLVASFCAFLLGVAKAGLKGMGVFVITIMAIIYGAKASTGIVLPLLMLGDIMAIRVYRRSVDWGLLKWFMPAMLLGVLVAVFLGDYISETTFKQWMSIIILFSTAMMFYQDRVIKNKFTNSWWLGGSSGFLAGFCTMIGNLAGAFTNLFFLVQRIPKEAFIGTAAWLYFIVNWFKLPFHVFGWNTISTETLKIDLSLAPFLILGFVVGVKIVKLFNQEHFRRFVLCATAIGALVILFKN